MKIQGYLFYTNSNPVPVPPNLGNEYDDFSTLLSDLNDLIERAKANHNPGAFCGYLLSEMSN